MFLVVDGFKMLIYGAEDIYLKFKQIFSETKRQRYNGKVFLSKTARFHHLYFTYYPISKEMEIRGSLHKYYNSKFKIEPIIEDHFETGFNYNDFNHNNIVKSILDLSSEINRNPMNLRLSNLESGINLRHSFDTPKILSGLLFFDRQTVNKEDWYYYFKLRQYLFKVYDKGAQFNLDYTLIRIEMSYNKMEPLNNIGLFNLQDLIESIDIYEKLQKMLIGKFLNKMIFWDYTTNLDHISDINQLNHILQFKDPLYWKNIVSHKRDIPKKELNFLIENYSINIRNELMADLSSLWWRLLYP